VIGFPTLGQVSALAQGGSDGRMGRLQAVEAALPDTTTSTPVFQAHLQKASGKQNGPTQSGRISLQPT